MNLSFKIAAKQCLCLSTFCLAILGVTNAHAQNKQDFGKHIPVITYLLEDSGRVKGPRPTPLPNPDGSKRLTDGLDFESCRFFAGEEGKARKNMPRRPYAFKFGWDNPNMTRLTLNGGTQPRTEFVTQLETRPFEGVAFNVNGITRNALTNQAFSYENVNANFTHYNIANLSEQRHDMVRLLANHVPGGFRQSTNAGNMINNLRNMAKAANQYPGIKGILFDGEVYDEVASTNPWVYSSAVCQGYQGAEGKIANFESGEARRRCDINAYNRGYLAMDAMISEWPDLVLLLPFGIWVDDPRTFETVNGRWFDGGATGYAPHVEWHHRQGVLGHFLAGMYAATICTEATFVDGVELYGLRSVSDFQKTATLITETIPNDKNIYLPENIRPAYRDEVGLGFGVYDDHDPIFANHAKWPIPQMKPNDWMQTIKNASDVATHYVWLYTERHDWWSKDHHNSWPETNVEEQPLWITATRQAIDYIKNK